MMQSTKILLLTAVFLVTIRAATAVDEIVGGYNGWARPSDAKEIGFKYQSWADSFNWTVGDSLVFIFESDDHNVLQVNETQFAECDASDPLAGWDNGISSVPLKKEGPMYFICGISGHCEGGQKFKINVGNVLPPPPPPSSPSTAALPSQAGDDLLGSSTSAAILRTIIAVAFYLNL